MCPDGHAALHALQSQFQSQVGWLAAVLLLGALLAPVRSASGRGAPSLTAAHYNPYRSQ